MSRYYEVSLRYDKMQENGAVRRVSEKYMADALSLTEAEAVVTEKMQPYISGEFVATSAKETKIVEICGDKECGTFYLGKVAFITIDEKTAKEKKTINQILVGAEDFGSAYNAVCDVMNGSIADWKLASLAESTIIDVF